MESPLFSAKTANECRATCIERVNGSPICSPTTASDWLIHFVALLRALYRASASSRSRSSFTKLKTYRHPARFSCHRCSICKAGSVSGITWRLFVLIMIFLSSFFSKFTCPHCNVITSTTRSPQAWKAKKNISKNSLRRGSVQAW